MGIFSSRRLKKLADRIQLMDNDHLSQDDYVKLAEEWGVSVQDINLASNIAIQRNELGDIEKLDGGTGSETKKTTIKSIIELFTGERRT